MKRYYCASSNMPTGPGGYHGWMQEDENGAYVLASDADRLIAEKDAEIERLRAKLIELDSQKQFAYHEIDNEKSKRAPIEQRIENQRRQLSALQAQNKTLAERALAAEAERDALRARVGELEETLRLAIEQTKERAFDLRFNNAPGLAERVEALAMMWTGLLVKDLP